MCEGGVATWNRSSGPRPRAWHQCSVAWPIERWVWRTALGSPVVPELKTSTDSSVSPMASVAGRVRLAAASASSVAGSSRSVTDPARGARASSAVARPVGDGVDGPGQLEGVADLERLPRRAEQHRRRAELADAVDRDHELGAVRRHDRHPVAGPDAPGGQVAGQGVAELVELGGTRTARRRPGRASRSPNRSAARSSPWCIRAAAIGNILLVFEIDVNTTGMYGSRPCHPPR